ncbi:FMN-dependent NADH-azoreductase [Streptomyces sp. NPDC002680]|uniref:FMN-dependent NADH-azoreductase n=1 Tax=Streptomyces sp. NPDC002680 TaxID=3364659 RepID=UPI00368BB898
MATLLHLDSSLWPESASASRSVTAAFRKAWQEQRPDGTVIYRDLDADPVPHLDTVTHSASLTDPAGHTPEQAAAFAARLELIAELESADAVLIGAPMHNFTVPSTLKAWLDQVLLIGRTASVAEGANRGSSVKGVPVYVVASRGGSYAPGTPREGYDYVQNYLEVVLGEMMGMEVDFVVPELTMAPVNPSMAELIPLAEESRARAHEEAVAKGKAAALKAAS